MKLLPLPAVQDNYLWLLHDGQRALVVDPGDAEPVRAGLRHAAVQLEAILVTHHHADHTGGVAALRDETGAQVCGPAAEAIPEPLIRLAQGDVATVLGLPFQVIEAPGHTAGHIPYHCPDDGIPTFPATLATERQINPFLRTRESAVIRAAQAFNGADPSDEAAVFGAIRQWKNELR